MVNWRQTGLFSLKWQSLPLAVKSLLAVQKKDQRMLVLGFLNVGTHHLLEVAMMDDRQELGTQFG